MYMALWCGFVLGMDHLKTLASGTRPDRGRPGSKPGLKAGVSVMHGGGGKYFISVMYYAIEALLESIMKSTTGG